MTKFNFEETKQEFTQIANIDNTTDSGEIFNKFGHLGLNCMKIANQDINKAAIIFAYVCKLYHVAQYGESIVIHWLNKGERYDNPGSYYRDAIGEIQEQIREETLKSRV